jgi:hypothetical protein
VKNIAGLDIDFKNTEFKSTRQIIYLYSCSNIDYFRNTIRARFPDSSQKIVFGTKVPGYWSYTPEVAFITSLVQQVNSSDTIVRNLNATRDCGSDCFVAY